MGLLNTTITKKSGDEAEVVQCPFKSCIYTNNIPSSDLFLPAYLAKRCAIGHTNISRKIGLCHRGLPLIKTIISFYHYDII